MTTGESSSALRASLAGRFAVGELAGKGGMGEVYAGHAVGGTRVAIKRVAAAGVADVARFVHEAEALERLAHPHVVRYVEHGVTAGGDHYLVTEWIEGPSLAQRLRDGGPLAIDEVLALARGVAGALVAAHAAGLIHRDLKPSNLMLPGGKAGEVKVIDFGIARAIGEGGGVTATGEIVGTPGFLAPEQARGARKLDGRADLFGLGTILYEAVTGRPAFAADDLMTTLALVLMHAPAPIGSLRDGVPPRLVALIDRLMAKEPDDRPASAGEVIAELDAIARGEPAPARTTPLRSDEAATVRERETPRSRMWIVIAAGAVLAAGAIAAVAVWGRGDDAPARLALECSKYDLVGCPSRCEAGDGDACFELGQATVNGVAGASQDRGAGIDLLRRACDLGELKGCVVGMSHLRLAAQAGELAGTGWQSEFVRRLELACRKGLGSACRMLASAYREGLLDPKGASIRKLLEQGCSLGDRASCVMLEQEP